VNEIVITRSTRARIEYYGVMIRFQIQISNWQPFSTTIFIRGYFIMILTRTSKIDMTLDAEAKEYAEACEI
jgi:hypothetical protein